MAGNNQPETDMVCLMETFKSSFSLKIIGYSLTKKLNPKNDMLVGSFDLGGHKWGVKFSPFGYHYNNGCGHEWMTLHISLLTETTNKMHLEVEYSLLDNESGSYSTKGVNAAKSEGNVHKQGDTIMRDYFMKNHIFENSGYLKDDCFILECSVELLTPCFVDTKKKRVIVPSSDFLQHFHQLWDSGEGVDVEFVVGEETYSAHRTVLAARSPVFKAEFFGSMQESVTESIRIKGIRPEVFKIMLHFVYTDELPLNEEVSFEMAQHLLIASDRYRLERLKLICEEILFDNIDVENASAILVLAEQHTCDQPKIACLHFVASGENLKSVMATDGFKHLMEIYPPILRDLLELVDFKRGTSDRCSPL